MLGYLGVLLALDVAVLAGRAVDSRAWPNPLLPRRAAPRSGHLPAP